MTVPLGNTPSGTANTPDELQTPGLKWMGDPANNGGQPVIVFYRTIEFGQTFAPKPQEPDKTVDPVTVDLYFPNGPLAGRVYRRVGFINVGLTRPIRATAIGSINVGQLALGDGRNGPYPQLNALDSDALDYASKIHQAAGGDVFAYYSGEPSAPVHAQQAAAPAAAPPVDRFAGQAPPPPAGFPGGQGVPAGPPAGMPGAAPAPTMTPPPAAPPAGFGPPPGMPGLGQPQPTTAPAPAGVPNLGAPPAWAQQAQG